MSGSSALDPMRRNEMTLTASGEKVATVEVRLTDIRKAIADEMEARKRLRVEVRTMLKGLLGESEDRVAVLREMVSTGRRSNVYLNPRTQAGPHNVETIRGEMIEREKVTQADLSLVTGLSSGTVTWAIKALVQEGVIEDLGNRRTVRGGNTRLWHYVGKAS